MTDFEEIASDIAQAIADYEQIFRVPYSLPPNLQLASRALAVAHNLHQEQDGRLEWGLRYGDGEVDELADLDEVVREIKSNRALIAEGIFLKEDYEPMVAVRRTVYQAEGPWVIADHCDPSTDTHVSPHNGCVLR